jgi:hypothetical protein
VRLDGDEMAADADDGDAGHTTGTYMVYQANTDRSGATYRFRSRSSARFAVLEVSHSVADAESDYKVENGGNDGY